MVFLLGGMTTVCIGDASSVQPFLSLQGIKKHLAASAPSGLAMDLMQQLTELQVGHGNCCFPQRFLPRSINNSYREKSL